MSSLWGKALRKALERLLSWWLGYPTLLITLSRCDPFSLLKNQVKKKYAILFLQFLLCKAVDLFWPLGPTFDTSGLLSSASRIATTLTHCCKSWDREHHINFIFPHHYKHPEEFTSNMWSWIFLFCLHSVCVCARVCVKVLGLIGYSLNLLIVLACLCPLHHRRRGFGSGEQQGLSLGGGLNQWWQSHDCFLFLTHKHTQALSAVFATLLCSHTGKHTFKQNRSGSGVKKMKMIKDSKLPLKMHLRSLLWKPCFF